MTDISSALVAENLPGASGYTDASEWELIERIKRRDPVACETLVRLHGGRMLQVAKRLMRCDADAADVVQDAMLSAFQAIQSFAGGARLSTWLHRITVNAALMKLRSRSRRPEIPLEGLPSFKPDGHHAKPVPAWADDALERASSYEVRQLVRECIDRLPDSYREVLLLRDIEQLDTAEVARLLNCTVANTKTRLHRARMALRTLLEPIFRQDMLA